MAYKIIGRGEQDVTLQVNPATPGAAPTTVVKRSSWLRVLPVDSNGEPLPLPPGAGAMLPVAGMTSAGEILLPVESLASVEHLTTGDTFELP